MYIKNKYHSCLMTGEDDLLLAVSGIGPRVNTLCSPKQAQPSLWIRQVVSLIKSKWIKWGRKEHWYYWSGKHTDKDKHEHTILWAAHILNAAHADECWGLLGVREFFAEFLESLSFPTNLANKNVNFVQLLSLFFFFYRITFAQLYEQCQ